jgi:hypothetical protein
MVYRGSTCPSGSGAIALALHRIPSSAMFEPHVQPLGAIESNR